MAAALLQSLLMMGGPLLIAALLIRRWRVPWGIWGAGAAGFVGSQLIHIPILKLLPLPKSGPAQWVILGLLAGLCEEPARYLVFTRWLKKIDRPDEGLIAGLGHGGIEAIALGALVLAGLQAPGALDAPVHLRALAVGERALAMTFHGAMSLLVLRAARRKNLWLLFAAVLAHALLDGAAVSANARWGMYGAEAVALAAALLGGLAILDVLRRDRLAREAARDVVGHPEEPRLDCALSTRTLTKDFDGRVAVDALTLDVEPGRVIALLGPNGAGKTTTVRMLCGLIPPTRGTASVAGQRVVTDVDALRAKVGILTETPGLYERLTAQENLELFARLYGLLPEVRAQRIEEHLRAFDLWERRDERVSGFSKGMKQKLAIVRALIHQPEVVFLDEPTSGLDPVASREVHEMVRRMKASGRTILLTTHRLAEAEELADLVAIVQSKLLVFDSFANLKKKMFGTEVRVRFAGGGELVKAVNDPEAEIPLLVRELVTEGKAILSVSEANHSLEEIYLGLVKT